MHCETYRGVRIRVTKSKTWGYSDLSINGVRQGRELGMDESKIAANQHGYIDMAGVRPGAFTSEWSPKS